MHWISQKKGCCQDYQLNLPIREIWVGIEPNQQTSCPQLITVMFLSSSPRCPRPPATTLLFLKPGNKLKPLLKFNTFPFGPQSSCKYNYRNSE